MLQREIAAAESNRTRNRGVRRHHQVPAHKRERGGMTESHLMTLPFPSVHQFIAENEISGKIAETISCTSITDAPYRANSTYRAAVRISLVGDVTIEV